MERLPQQEERSCGLAYIASLRLHEWKLFNFAPLAHAHRSRFFLAVSDCNAVGRAFRRFASGRFIAHFVSQRLCRGSNRSPRGTNTSYVKKIHSVFMNAFSLRLKDPCCFESNLNCQRPGIQTEPWSRVEMVFFCLHHRLI